MQWATVDENVIINAIGPETYTYRELAEMISRHIGVRRPIISVSPRIGYLAGRLLGYVVGDVMITRPEIEGLMADLLYVADSPTGKIRLSEWVRDNAATLGQHYTSELARRKDRVSAYRSD